MTWQKKLHVQSNQPNKKLCNYYFVTQAHVQLLEGINLVYSSKCLSATYDIQLQRVLYFDHWSLESSFIFILRNGFSFLLSGLRPCRYKIVINKVTTIICLEWSIDVGDTPLALQGKAGTDYVTHDYIHQVYLKDMASISDKLFQSAQDRSSMWGYIGLLIGVLILMLVIPVFVIAVKKYLRERVDKTVSTADQMEMGTKRQGLPPQTMTVRHSLINERPGLPQPPPPSNSVQGTGDSQGLG